MGGEGTSTIAIVIGAFVTIIGGFGAIAKIMLNQSAKDRDADRDERIKLTTAIENMAQSNAKVAEVTDRGFDKLSKETAKQSQQAEQRNGHLAELVMQSTETNKALAESSTAQIITAVQNVKEQHVKHQTVEHETVEDKSKKRK